MDYMLSSGINGGMLKAELGGSAWDSMLEHAIAASYIKACWDMFGDATALTIAAKVAAHAASKISVARLATAPGLVVLAGSPYAWAALAVAVMVFLLTAVEFAANVRTCGEGIDDE